MSVGILVVSHSAKIAEGVVDLAREMAPDVRFVAAGGTDGGGIGTSFDAITEGIAELADTDGVVVLCDLGSAYLTTDTALDFLDDDDRARVSVSHAPLVEGTVAAAVAAQTGGGVADVVAASETAGGGTDGHDDRPGGTADVAQASPVDDADRSGTAVDAGGASSDSDDAGSDVGSDSDSGRGDGGSDDAAGSGSGVVTASVELVNESGLHARPAADFVRTAARFSAAVRVNDVDAKSLLAIMALALPKGATLTITARGVDAEDAVGALVELVHAGFGED